VVDLLATRATVRDAVVRWETAEMVNIIFVRFDVRVVRVGVFGSCVGRGAARVSMSDVSWCLRCLFASVVTSRVWFFWFLGKSSLMIQGRRSPVVRERTNRTQITPGGNTLNAFTSATMRRRRRQRRRDDQS
jgi:integral membrane sensor domain MASE1